MKKPQENIEGLGNISIKKIDILSDTKKGIEKIILSIKNNHPDILIIGNGEIGDKAKAFLDKTTKIHEAGFKTTKKIILGSDVIAKCMEEKRSDDNSFFRKLVDGINLCFQKSPLLIVRSSGQGDARGIGIYKSEFVENNTNLMNTIRYVYESNFTNSAKEYRKKMGIKNDGMGIIIEPCIGDIYTSERCIKYSRWEMEFFGPLLSGWYKTQESGIPEIGINGGLGGGVESRNFDKLECQYQKGSILGESIPKERFEIESLRIANLMDSCSFPKVKEEESFQGLGFNSGEIISEGEVASLKLQRLISNKIPMHSIKEYKNILFDDVKAPEAINNNIFKYPVGKFIQSIKRLEGNLGKQQYLEWAVKLNKKGKFDTYITQIADQTNISLSINFNKDAECILDLYRCINRSGIKTNIKTIILMPCYTKYENSNFYNYKKHKNGFLSIKNGKFSMDFLEDLNKEYSNYILMVGEHNMSGKGALSFNCFSNAAGIIEYHIHGDGHENKPASHYQGLLDSTNILFSSILENREIDDMLFKLFSNKELHSNIDEIRVLEIDNNKTITWTQDAKKGIGKLFLEDKEIPPKV